MAKPKFKLGDKVRFSRVAYREMTLLAAENDPKPWYDVKWVSREPKKLTTATIDSSFLQDGIWIGPRIEWVMQPLAEQQGIYVGTRTKQNGLLTISYTEEGRTVNRFKRLFSVPCGLVVTDVRKNPILVLIEDLEHV